MKIITPDESQYVTVTKCTYNSKREFLQLLQELLS